MTPISSSIADQGTHERQVRAMFPGAFEWRGTAPVYQTPLYILAFTNRSGSNLLADYLRQTGLLRGFGEGLNWDHIERDIARAPTASFPDYITQLAGPPGGTQSWGIKASWDQIVMLQRARIPAMFSGVRIIHTVREDIVGQAISHWIAHQTNRWTSAHQETGVVPWFSLEGIEPILMDITRSNTLIKLVSAALGAPRHVVVYERLQDDPLGEVQRLGEAMDLDLGDWRPAAPRIARQRDETNAEFREASVRAWREAIGG